MKKIAVAAVCILLLCSCAKPQAEVPPSDPSPSVSVLTWQEQYDLGLRFLSEGNYEEAIIAFTAAIEIDPKRAEAYNSLADVHLAAGNIDAALAILRKGYETVGDNLLQLRLQELLSVPTSAPTPVPGLTPPPGYMKETTDISLSYADIPEMFSLNYNELGGILNRGVISDQSVDVTSGDENEGGSTTERVESCIYYNSGISASETQSFILANAKPGGGRFMDMVFVDAGMMLKGQPIGWRGIEMGDSFTTVMEKMDLAELVLERNTQVMVWVYNGTRPSQAKASATSGCETISLTFEYENGSNYTVSHTIHMVFSSDDYLIQTTYQNYGER